MGCTCIVQRASCSVATSAFEIQPSSGSCGSSRITRRLNDECRSLKSEVLMMARVRLFGTQALLVTLRQVGTLPPREPEPSLVEAGLAYELT
jgi:hypothetical protein